MKLVKNISVVFSAAFLLLALTNCGKSSNDNNAVGGGGIAAAPVCQANYTYDPSYGQCLPGGNYGYNGGYNGGYGASSFCGAGYGLYHNRCVPASYCQSNCAAGQTAVNGYCQPVDACDPCYAHIGNSCVQQ